MNGLGGNLKIGVDVLDVVNDFLRALDARGVSIVDIKSAVADGEHMDAIVQAITSPKALQEARLVELGTLADDISEVRARNLLEHVFPGRPHLVRLYSEPETLDRLLASIRKGGSWQRAAIVLFYGLGRDGRAYSVEKVAEKVGRSVHTVAPFLSTERSDYTTAVEKLASTRFAVLSHGSGFLPLQLAVEVRELLARGEVRSLAELRCCTAEEVRELFAGPKENLSLYSELMSLLRTARIQLWQ